MKGKIEDPFKDILRTKDWEDALRSGKKDLMRKHDRALRSRFQVEHLKYEMVRKACYAHWRRLREAGLPVGAQLWKGG